MDLFFLDSLFSFFTGLYPWRHLASIFWLPEDNCSNTFASALTVFLIVLSQESSSWPRVSNCIRIKDLRTFQKY